MLMKHLITLLLCSYTLCTYANNDTLTNGKKKNFIRGFHVVAPVEFPFIDNNDINKNLATAGLPDFKTPVTAIGLGYRYQRNRWVFNAGFNTGVRRPHPDTVELETTYTSYSLNAGYDIIKSPTFSLLPFAGIKVNSIKYRYNQAVPEGTNFGTYLTTRLDHKELSRSVTHLDMGLGFSHQRFYFIGIRAGYLLPVYNNTWKTAYNKVILSNGPTIAHQGYISIIIGIGSLSSGKGEQQEDEVMLDDLM